MTAQLWVAATATAVAVVSRSTVTGLSARWYEPLPRAPPTLAPQQRTTPSAPTAQAWSSATATSTGASETGSNGPVTSTRPVPTMAPVSVSVTVTVCSPGVWSVSGSVIIPASTAVKVAAGGRTAAGSELVTATVPA